MVKILNKENTILNKFIAQMRDKSIQRDAMRFRRNMERVAEIMAYEISKKLNYATRMVETPLGIAAVEEISDKVVVATILRAGLPFHQGFLNYFDDAESGFVSAYRKSRPDGSFIVDVEYVATSSLSGKTLILVDPMLTTGTSLMLVYDALVRRAGEPEHTHFAAAFASEEGVENVLKHTNPEKCTLWCAAVDPELTAKSYIVPGIGDAGDLAYGVKL
ncbi:MAG: uracil phosphoribosyltransferase [Alistipes sp.]|jgi:uracil phosphoribosyltransferase|nr:uracil phosphoribosyltransferase [Alistipes sp.]MBQ5924696.1 uracil phosphoribosyltransferase [Alistipes sp.]MBR5819430.1 uracil phosphoribosyltransferase [Alistipes sp.]